MCIPHYATTFINRSSQLIRPNVYHHLNLLYRIYERNLKFEVLEIKDKYTKTNPWQAILSIYD
jgi:hypothetical protein